jgi:hypothetical protein
MKSKIINILLFLSVFLLTHCANMVTPTGGPKDMTPPKVTEAMPENHSVNFNGKKIEITFDEYLTLENASQQVLFSPPLNEKPDIKLNNKTVLIKLKEELKPNTTYTIDFGQAVKDLHEGNIFKDYVYSFSTGEQLDTLTITGKVLDAETQKPVEKLFVTLYSNPDSIPDDSLFFRPTLRKPDFITRTDKDGKFQFHGLPNKKFLLFALDDVNSNLYYDMPNEKVAFIDTLIFPSDSLVFTLYSFIEVDTNQMILEKKLIDVGMLRFAFRHPAEKVKIEMPETLPDTFQIIKVWSQKHDTLTCYFTPNIIDSLKVNIQYDTLIKDTTKYSLSYRASQQRRGKTVKDIKVTSNLRNNLLPPGEDLLLKFSEPVIDIRMNDTSKLIINTDTLINTMRFEQADDYGMAYRLVVSVDDTSNYVLSMADSVFYTLRNRTNNPFTFRFKRAKESDFGSIFIIVAPPEETQVIIQLFDSRNKTIATQAIDSTTRVSFKQLTPDKYKLKAIIDTDRNGKWSTGNFHRCFLPETTIEYKDELDLKAGWDIDLEEVWNLH